MPPEKRQRIDQILSRYGHCSRSEARAWLGKQRVSIQGQTATSPNDRAFPHEVLVDGQPIECPDGLLALMHKPDGYACSHDPREAPTVYELIPERWLRRNPAVTTIGRLDRNSTGVLLFTDDGQLVQRWISPRHKFPKLYEVTVDADLPPGMADVFASGQFRLSGEDKPCLPATLEILGPRTARLELVEGRYHQVKRMFAAHGCHVLKLHRSQFGPYQVTDLAPGQWRVLEFPNLNARQSG